MKLPHESFLPSPPFDIIPYRTVPYNTLHIYIIKRQILKQPKTPLLSKIPRKLINIPSPPTKPIYLSISHSLPPFSLSPPPTLSLSPLYLAQRRKERKGYPSLRSRNPITVARTDGRTKKKAQMSQIQNPKSKNCVCVFLSRTDTGARGLRLR